MAGGKNHTFQMGSLFLPLKKPKLEIAEDVLEVWGVCVHVCVFSSRYSMR